MSHIAMPKDGEDVVQVEDWFSVSNVEHILGFKEFVSKRMWPDGLLPNNVMLSLGWQLRVVRKLADAWMFHVEQVHKEVSDESST